MCWPCLPPCSVCSSSLSPRWSEPRAWREKQSVVQRSPTSYWSEICVWCKLGLYASSRTCWWAGDQAAASNLRHSKVDGAVLSLGYLPDPIQAYLCDKQDLVGFSVDYAVEDHALGTAGGIKNAEKYLDGDTLVVVNGDVLTGMDLSRTIQVHKASDALATIVLTSVEDPTAYGLVEVDHEMLVHRFIEKPAADEVTTNLVNAGVYVLEPEVLAMIPEDREVSIEREIFPELQESGRLRANITSSYWRDIGTPRSYLAASHDVLSGAVGARDGFEYQDVDPSVECGKNIRLLPPVSIAEGCKISDLASIGGRSSLGK